MPVREDGPTIGHRPPWAGFDPDPPAVAKPLGAPYANFLPDGGAPEFVPEKPQPVGKGKQGVGKFVCIHCDMTFGTKQERQVHLVDCASAPPAEPTME